MTINRISTVYYTIYAADAVRKKGVLGVDRASNEVIRWLRAGWEDARAVGQDGSQIDSPRPGQLRFVRGAFS